MLSIQRTLQGTREEQGGQEHGDVRTPCGIIDGTFHALAVSKSLRDANSFRLLTRFYPSKLCTGRARFRMDKKTYHHDVYGIHTHPNRRLAGCISTINTAYNVDRMR